MTALNVYQDALKRLQDICTRAELSGQISEALSHPLETLSASLPIRMDDGSTRYFVGYRCRYNDTLGPTKGGIRFHPNVTIEEVQALALWMTIKCAVLGIPYGGGKGGVVVDPKQLSRLELERLSRAYMRTMSEFVGPHRDIPAPDVYTNARIMGWMYDEYCVIKRKKVPAVITGKPIALGGSLGRDAATGRGAFICIEELARIRSIEPQKTRVAVQGFGNAGYHAARLLQGSGYQIVGISDSRGAIYSNEGFDVESIYHQKSETRELQGVYCTGSVCHSVDHKRLSKEELLSLDVDILLLAALEGAITVDNVGQIKAPLIVEVSNGGVTSAADQQLQGRGVSVLPDVLVNSGGVLVSYFEWLQNLQGEYWPQERVERQLSEVMVRVFSEVWQVACAEELPVRDAAYRRALSRIEEAMSHQGTKEFFSGSEG